MIKKLKEYLALKQRQQKVREELTSMTERELSDIGIGRSQINDIVDSVK